MEGHRLRRRTTTALVAALLLQILLPPASTADGWALEGFFAGREANRVLLIDPRTYRKSAYPAAAHLKASCQGRDLPTTRLLPHSRVKLLFEEGAVSRIILLEASS